MAVLSFPGASWCRNVAVNVSLKAVTVGFEEKGSLRCFGVQDFWPQCFLAVLCFHILFCRLLCLLWSSNACIRPMALALSDSTTNDKWHHLGVLSVCRISSLYLGRGGGRRGTRYISSLPLWDKILLCNSGDPQTFCIPQISLMLGTLAQPFKCWDYKRGLQHMPQFCVSNKIPEGHLRSLGLNDRTVAQAPGVLWIKNGALRNVGGYKDINDSITVTGWAKSQIYPGSGWKIKSGLIVLVWARCLERMMADL